MAKCFYRVSEGDENTMAPPLTISENREQIYRELNRLTVGAYFLKAFFRHASHSGVNVYTGV